MFGLFLVALTAIIAGYQSLRILAHLAVGSMDRESLFSDLVQAGVDEDPLPPWFFRAELWFWPSLAEDIIRQRARRQAWEDKLR